MRRSIACYILGHKWITYWKHGGQYIDRRGYVRSRNWMYSRCDRCGWDTQEDPYFHDLDTDLRAIRFKVVNFFRSLVRKPPKDNIPF